jgi:serine protease Do
MIEQGETMKNKFKHYGMFLVFILLGFPFISTSNGQIPTSAPMTTDLAGRSGNVAIPSIFRVIIPRLNRGGTGFLHKSGNVVTAAHVVASCSPNDIKVIDFRGQTYVIDKVIIDENIDLALLKLGEKINIPALEISPYENFAIGRQVSTWGYPEGYRGLPPLLMSGYLLGSAVDDKGIPRWVVNAAISNGNSGGPLLEIEKGKVIGVVFGKLAPLPQDIESALRALKSQRSGFGFTKTYPDGKKEDISDAQVIEEVLQYLRSHPQLVIGYAIMIGDLKTFLRSNDIDP